MIAARVAGAVVAGIICNAAMHAFAQTPDAARAPDLNHGAVIAAQGTRAGAPACAQCHAFNGASDASGAFPRIAGQSSYYLARQLRDFTSAVRRNAVMSPIARALSPDEIEDVAAYYAAAKAPSPPLANPDPALVKRGAELANVGDAAHQIQACNACHGPGGTGEPPAIPYLAGQYGSYIALELRMWQRGFRNSSPNSMAVVARKLTDAEIAAVAAYYQQTLGAAETRAAR